MFSNPRRKTTRSRFWLLIEWFFRKNGSVLVRAYCINNSRGYLLAVFKLPGYWSIYINLRHGFILWHVCFENPWAWSCPDFQITQKEGSYIVAPSTRELLFTLASGGEGKGDKEWTPGTVDGSISAITTWNVNRVNNGITYQPQLVSRISEPSTVALYQTAHGLYYCHTLRFCC